MIVAVDHFIGPGGDPGMADLQEIIRYVYYCYYLYSAQWRCLGWAYLGRMGPDQRAVWACTLERSHWTASPSTPFL